MGYTATNSFKAIRLAAEMAEKSDSDVLRRSMITEILRLVRQAEALMSKHK